MTPKEEIILIQKHTKTIQEVKEELLESFVAYGGHVDDDFGDQDV